MQQEGMRPKSRYDRRDEPLVRQRKASLLNRWRNNYRYHPGDGEAWVVKQATPMSWGRLRAMCREAGLVWPTPPTKEQMLERLLRWMKEH